MRLAFLSNCCISSLETSVFRLFKNKIVCIYVEMCGCICAAIRCMHICVRWHPYTNNGVCLWSCIVGFMCFYKSNEVWITISEAVHMWIADVFLIGISFSLPDLFAWVYVTGSACVWVSLEFCLCFLSTIVASFYFWRLLFLYFFSFFFFECCKI